VLHSMPPAWEMCKSVDLDKNSSETSDSKQEGCMSRCTFDFSNENTIVLTQFVHHLRDARDVVVGRADKRNQILKGVLSKDP
jgi:hypothetical protein